MQKFLYSSVQKYDNTPNWVMRAVCSDDTTPEHQALCQAGFENGYGGVLNGRFSIDTSSFSSALSFLRGYGLVTRSLAGVESYVSSAESYYPQKIQIVMPMGSNSYIEYTYLTSIPVIVVTGAGDTQNRTAYGNGLEFWDVASTSSEANAIIAGKLFKIQDTLQCRWWEARYRARMTASNNGVWDKFNGYGKINVSAAIAYNGTIIEDPYARTLSGAQGIPTSTSGFGYGGSLELVSIKASTRVTTAGLAQAITFDCLSTGGSVVNYIFKVWRRNSGTGLYSQVGQNIVIPRTSLVLGVNTYLIANPIPVQVDDYLGFGYSGNGVAMLGRVAGVLNDTRNTLLAPLAQGTQDYNWDGEFGGNQFYSVIQLKERP